MANGYLIVPKGLYGSGLSPIEILVLSQIMEFDRNTGDCFISNAVMAKNFGVSEKTVSRAVASLEEKGLINRNTKNIQKGKERHIILTTDNLSLASLTKDFTKDKLSLAEKSNCPLRNGQNDPIKDNNKNIKEKEKNEIVNSALVPRAELTISENQPQEEQKYQRVSKREMKALGVPYETVDESKGLYRILATNKIVQAI